MFEVQVKCFQMIGFFRQENVKHLKFIKRLPVFWFVIVLIAIYGNTNFIVQNFYDVLAAAECFGPLATELITMSKLLTFIVCKKKIFELIERLEELSNDITAVDFFTLTRAQKIDQSFATVFLVSSVVTGISLLVAPIAKDFFMFFLHGIEFNRDLPMPVVFPFDMKSFPGYEGSYLLLTLATYVTILLSVSCKTEKQQQVNQFFSCRLASTLCF